jgi:hypothetical protein
MFENMTYETFQTAVKPKVQGSRNLHEILPLAVDFFILFSSATGILGNRSQANYTAGNTYQDALAHHRLSKGLPAATIDLGTVLSVGYVAENKDRVMVSKSFATILEVLCEDEIQALIEYLSHEPAVSDHPDNLSTYLWLDRRKYVPPARHPHTLIPKLPTLHTPAYLVLFQAPYFVGGRPVFRCPYAAGQRDDTRESH